LWKCDGTNLTRLTTVNPSSGLNPLALTVFNNALFFFATSDSATYGLWKYDGVNSPARVGTMVLNSLNNLLVYNGALYMGAATSGTDFEPWKYDGTNFTFLGQVNAGGTNATPVFWATYRNQAFFSANDGIHGTGYQLWSCDGTNLTRLTDFVTGGIYAFTFNDTLYFTANDGLTGYELWKYDGTAVSQVADINPGFNGSLPEPLSAFNNTYLFQATDGLHGTELWRLDPLSSVFRITQIKPQGNDVSVTWITPGGWTNVVQAANGLGGTNNFSDRSSSIVAVNGDVVTTNYLDVGGAINHPSRFYRIRLGP
jgi:ELWxxDGT repeat protein